MRLGDSVNMVLGTCMSNDDPEKLGRIKVGAPGYFDRTVMAIEAIPWAYPLTMSSCQSYSTITEGSKVWLIDNEQNEDEYWYIPFHEFNNDTKAAIGNDIMTDVLFSRNSGGKLVQIYSNDTDGIVIKNGDNNVILGPDGKVSICSDGVNMTMEGQTIYIGTDGGQKIPMVRSDILTNVLSDISSNMNVLYKASQNNPYIAVLSPAFMDISTSINNALSELTSSTVTISK